MNQRRSERNKSVEETNMDDTLLNDVAAKYGSRTRVTSEQRNVMIQFLQQHPSLANNSFSQPNANEVKRHLWAELTKKLNACHGPKKSVDKWSKTWQDWRCDTRRKAAKIHKLSITGAEDGSALRVTRFTAAEELLLKITEMRPEPKEINPGTSLSNQDISPEASGCLSFSIEQPDGCSPHLMKSELAKSKPNSSPHHDSSSNISDFLTQLTSSPHNNANPSDSSGLQNTSQANRINDIPGTQEQRSRKRRISMTDKDDVIDERMTRAAEIRALAEEQKAKALMDIAKSFKELSGTVGDSLKRALDELVLYLRRS